MNDNQIIKDAMRDFKAGFEEFKANHKAELAELKHKFEAKNGREKFPLGGIDGNGTPEKKTEGRVAFERYMRVGSERLSQDEHKAMVLNNDPQGGYAVEGTLAAEIQKVGAEQGVIRNLAKNYTPRNGDFSVVVNADLAGATWINEGATRAATSTPTLGRIHPMKGGIYAVAPVSNWLLDDASYPIAEFVADSIGTQFGVSESAAFVSGDGINKPIGFLAYPMAATADATRPFGTLEKLDTAGGASSLVIDDVIGLVGRLAPRYRKNAQMVMHPDIATVLRKLKASTSGDYYWQPSTVVGQPDSLLGYPVRLDVNMPSTVASANAVIAFGDWQKGYAVVDIGTMTMLRDPLTSKGNTLFYAEKRIGGAVVDSNALKILVSE